MNNMKKALVATGALMALAGQPVAAEGTDQDFLLNQVEAGYSQFSADLNTFCEANQAFTSVGDPAWVCSKEGVDQGIRVVPHGTGVPA